MGLGLAFLILWAFSTFGTSMTSFVWAMDIDTLKESSRKQMLGCLIINIFSLVSIVLYIVFIFPILPSMIQYEIQVFYAIPGVSLVLNLVGLGVILCKIMEK